MLQIRVEESIDISPGEEPGQPLSPVGCPPSSHLGDETPLLSPYTEATGQGCCLAPSRAKKGLVVKGLWT